MASRPAAEVFGTDFTNKAAVIALADKLGEGMRKGALIVIKHRGRANYNIVHADRRDRWDKPSIKVIHRT